ncbi:MAG: tetratricopeptide repeat protein, partial [Chlorobi bacterium]|nr:tetratricopeptide repeat protein [Chlorobiota bacterium]
MKPYLFFLVAIAITASCQNSKSEKKQQKTETEEVVAEENTQSNNENGEWFGSKTKPQIVKVDTTVTKNNAVKLKSKKKKTAEEIKRDKEIKNARSAFKRGVNAYNSKKTEEAIEAFKETLMYDPENALASYNLGKIYYETGQKELAMKYYDEDASQFNPADSNSIVAIGLIYFERGQFDQAEDYFNQALNIAPGYGLAYYNRGTLYGQQKKYDKSLDDLNKAAIYSPSDSKVFMNRGMAYYFHKNMDAACADWNKAASMGNA